MIKRWTKNWSLRPEVDIRDILEVFGCTIFSRKSIKLKRIHESFSSAWKLLKVFFKKKVLSSTLFFWKLRNISKHDISLTIQKSEWKVIKIFFLHWCMARVTSKKTCLRLLVTTLDGLENLLVIIDDHFGHTRKFDCDYWWSLWTDPKTFLCLNLWLDFCFGWYTGQLLNLPGAQIFSRTGSDGELCCI